MWWEDQWGVPKEEKGLVAHFSDAAPEARVEFSIPLPALPSLPLPLSHSSPNLPLPFCSPSSPDVPSKPRLPGVQAETTHHPR